MGSRLERDGDGICLTSAEVRLGFVDTPG